MDIELNVTLILLASTGLAIYLISILFIHEFLKRRNDKTPGIFNILLNANKYARKYRYVSRGEHRKSGALSYMLPFSLILFIASIILLLVINILVK